MLVSSGSAIKFWNTDNFELIQDLHINSGNSPISNISWNKDGHFLAALEGKTSEISLYTVSSSTGICTGIFRIMENINCIQFCNTVNRYIAIGGSRDAVLIWDIKGNAKKKSFVVARAGVTKLCFNNSDTHLAVGTNLGNGFLLSNTNNLVTGPVKLFSDKTKVTDIRFSATSRSLVGVCAENGSAVLMDTNSTKVLKEFPQVHSAPVSALAFSPINELLMITAGCDKKFVTYNASCKSILSTHQTTAPLTSACFLNGGQCVALGAMTGEIFIYDLRAHQTPMVTIVAQDGPVLDLRIQPEGKVSGPSTSKGVSGTKTVTQKIDVSDPAEKEKPHKTDKTVEFYSPTAELLSPMKMQATNRAERMNIKNTPLLKNLTRTPKRTKGSFKMDDLVILSPIDKENKSPTTPSQLSEGPQRQCAQPDLMIEGLLSPLETAPRSSIYSPVKSTPSNPSSSTVDEKCDEPTLPVQDIDGILSPLRSESGFSSDGPVMSPLSSKSLTPKETVSMTTESKITSPSKPEAVSEERRSSRERRRSNSVERVKRNPLNDKEGITLEAESLTVPISLSDLPVGDSEEVLSKKTPEKPSSSREGRPFSLKHNQETEQPLVSDYSEAASLCRSKGVAESSKQASDRNESQETNRAFEIAFPTNEEGSQETLKSGIAGVRKSSRFQSNLANSNSSSVDVGQLNLELIKNCVSESLERHQFCINQRFMHLQYTMVKHIFNLKKDMREMVKEFSLNEELLAENQRLKQENERLKCTY